jgi:hypothetical protein
MLQAMNLHIVATENEVYTTLSIYEKGIFRALFYEF